MAKKCSEFSPELVRARLLGCFNVNVHARSVSAWTTVRVAAGCIKRRQ